MKTQLDIRQSASKLLCIAFAASLALPLSALAAPITLATSPLANSTTSSVLPNLMFILDNSGSMAWDFTPDYISERSGTPADGDKQCRDSGDDDSGTVYSGAVSGSTRVLDLCVVGDPPYMNSDMNTQYYNPAIRYTPAANFDGSSKASQSNPASVLTDAYNKQNTNQLLDSKTTVNLTTEYPDRVWCTKSSPTAAELTNTSVCRTNTDYLYPNATFKYGRTTGSPNQRVTESMLNDVIKVSGAPYYYSVIPSEYCDAADLRNCIAASAPSGAYINPARSRWCDDAKLTNCQSTRTSKYKYPRYIGAPAVTAVAATGSVTVGSSKGNSIDNIKVNGIDILGTKVSWGNTKDNSGFANAIKDQINNFASTPEYTATVSGSTITITSTAVAGATGNGNISITGSGSFSTSSGGMTGGVTGMASIAPYTFTRTDIVSSTATYPKSGGRTDCGDAAATTCTYAEEITNFGNWYTYYRTRMQAMKTAASLAFKPIGTNFRVGFITIANQGSAGNYLPIDTFSSGASGTNSQKEKWYGALFNINPSTSTPLRSALSIVGRIFAGQKPVGSADPVQYSCQQNFALLTTDGYWNTDTSTDVKGLDGGSVGNLDNDINTRPKYEGPTASSNTLADVAKYYYETDLRTSGLNNCAGALGAGIDVCKNNVFVTSSDNNAKQHMTTFTLGLGVDGTLSYTNDYSTATSGDFYKLKNALGSPVINWPVPVADTETAVDDLWHAAVNGGGTYFSAKDPAQLASGLNTALASIGSKIGSGAAAATSTLNPVAGDNFAYVASYTTVKWQGNLEARTINLDTGVVSESAEWSVENIISGVCSAPGTIVKDSSGGSNVYNCVTPDSTAATCSGTLTGTDCKVEMPVARTGTMGDKVGAASDTRSIYMRGSAGSLVNFTYGNMTATQQSYFTGTSLSQRTLMDDTQKAAAAGTNLVNYLRGQTGFESRSSNPAANRLFRFREATLGDAIESQPAFVGKPSFSYTDPGYSSFVTAQAGRGKTVFMGTNDGMLHAFNADNGVERWAYVPSMVIPNMWKLADSNYATMHTNYVNGSPVIADIYDGSAWRTILVAGLNGGGRGYYALDITNPDSPSLLWEIDSGTEANLGYSFGQPVVTKKNDGTWTVLLTSGYNNISPGDGKGYVFVRNALTGAAIGSPIPLPGDEGDSATPTGLAKIASWADSPEKNNTTTYTYGGDLYGNVWRIDINAGAAMKFAVLKDSAGARQPITTRPELGQINGKRVIFVGTGKYLETSDLTDMQQQSLYAIKDDDAATTLDNPRTILVQQTITTSDATRTASANPVDFRSARGWYFNLPDAGERVNIDSRLDSGTLIAPTTVPSNTVCEPGGTGWLNYVNYQTGSAVAGAEGSLVSQKFSAPIVGVNIFRLPNGKRITTVVTADHPTPEQPPKSIGGESSASGFVGKRVIWRELNP